MSRDRLMPMKILSSILWLGFALQSSIQSDAAVMATLTSIKIVQRGAVTRVEIFFNSPLPPYRVSQDDPQSLTTYFSSSTKASALTESTAGSGLVHSVTVFRSGNEIAVKFSIDANALPHLVRSPNALFVEFSAPQTALYAVSNSASVVSALGVGQITKVITLKYADINEIVALVGGAAPATDEQMQQSSLMGQPIASSASYGSGALQPSFNTSTIPAGTISPLGNGQMAIRVNEHLSLDRRLNAAIVTGTPGEVSALVDLIAAVDVPDAPQTSVVFEAQIVELTDTAARRVGIDFTNNGAIASANIQIHNLSSPSSGLQLQAQVFAEISNGGGKLLARPRVQTLNGTPASILTGDALPIITTVTYPGNPPTIQQQLQYVNVGVHLQIQPHVSANGFITSRVIAEVSNVTAFIDGNIPQISQRQAIATARVRDGTAYVIGGLLQDNEIKTMSKIPILGDLPILGSLFRTKNLSHDQTNLYIIVTPHIQTENAAAPPVP